MPTKEIAVLGRRENSRDGSIIKVRIVEFTDTGSRCLNIRKCVSAGDKGLKFTTNGIMLGPVAAEWLLSLLEQSREEIAETINPIVPTE